MGETANECNPLTTSCVCVCVCVCVGGGRQRIIDEFLSKTNQIQQKWLAENQKMKEQEEKFYVRVEPFEP